MKKALFLSLIVASAIGYSQVEAQLKFGYDFLRTVNKLETPTVQDQIVDNGLNLSLEIIPINVLNNRLEFGLGAQYTGGFFKMFPTANNKDYILQVPVYTLIKGNLINVDNGDTPLYIGLKGGYSFQKSFVQGKNLPGGPMVGVTIGSEYKSFVGELAYDATFIPTDTVVTANADGDAPTNKWYAFHKLGVNFGIRFNAPKFEEPTIVEPEVKEEPVVIVKPVEEEKPVVKEEPKPEPVKEVEVVKPKHGILVMDVRTHKDTGLGYNTYSKDNLPDVIYLNMDGTVATKGNEVLGSNGSTNAQYVYLLDENDKEVLSGNGPLIHKLFNTKDEKNKGFYLETGKDGKTRIKFPEPVKEVVVEKPVLFPSHCSDDKCIIYGFAVDGRVPNNSETEQVKLLVESVNNYAKSANITIVGNTDSTGSEVYNNKLGMTRAQNIAKLLIENGLKGTIKIVNIMSDGENNPQDTNKTKEGRYRNRRVEIIFSDLVK